MTVVAPSSHSKNGEFYIAEMRIIAKHAGDDSMMIITIPFGVDCYETNSFLHDLLKPMESESESQVVTIG